MINSFFRKMLSVLVVLFVLIGFGYTPTWAQSPSNNLDNKQELYREQIGVYRDSERTFEIAKEQYFKLQTLSALEQAVSGTRNVLLARSKVLITYLEILREELTGQLGVNLTAKEEVIGRLDTQLTYLKTHQDAVLLATNRDELLVVVADFQQNQEAIQDAVYRTRTLLAIGKIQTVTDKARTLLQDITKAHAAEDVTSLVESKRNRAYTEIEKHIDETQTTLIAIMDEEYTLQTKPFNRSRFEQITNLLSEPYVTAQKSLGFLEELLNL